MKYYVVAVGLTNGIPDMKIDETEDPRELGKLLNTYHKRGLAVAAFMGEQIRLNGAITHYMMGDSIRAFYDMDPSEFSGDFIEGEDNE